MQPAPVDQDLLRELAPQVLGALVRRYGHFHAAEDAVQEALFAAVRQWPEEGVPQRPLGWLVLVASRRLVDRLRSDRARRDREARDAAARGAVVASVGPVSEEGGAAVAAVEVPPEGGMPGGDADDSLLLLLLCCHPSLTAPSQIALTLRAVGGLTTAEIAGAFLVPEATMGQRISRAKQTVAKAGARFALPPAEEMADRIAVVAHVLYLVFDAGYTSRGADPHRVALSAEAIRLARLLRRTLPDDGEVAGLLALMVLTDARRLARTTATGDLVPLAEQDRGRWDREMIAEGVALVEAAMAGGAPGPYRLQAAIAALHDEAPSAAETDWLQILGLYTLLDRLADNPVVTLNRAVALAMVHGPAAGLRAVEEVAADPRLARHFRVWAVRAHLLERAGEHADAMVAYREAATRTASTLEQRYLLGRVARLTTACPRN